jgi:hemerythrin
MKLIEWDDDSMSVNVQEIDQQHKQLVKLINELHDAMRERKTKDTLGKIIQGLIDYTGSHFATEEKYFDAFGYPEADAHKATHQEFVAKVMVFQTGFTEGRLLLSLDVMNFLREWLVDHIMGDDHRYGPFFNEHGLT